jgi:MerR family transcriptional regulator, light-induced transcriptional regulator
MCPLPDVSTGSNEPLYNIGVVSRMTDISMATLRAWERRYDFPELERTAGGHRLYSERDVLHLRWVKERINAGMQTAQAINALRHQESTGHLIQIKPDNHRDLETAKKAGPQMQTYQFRLVERLFNHDVEGADVVLSEVVAFSSPEDLILDVISPALAQIGDAWETGKINVQTEHLATNFLRERLVMWMMSGPPPRAINPIVLACAPNEWHEGSLLILGALLRRRRWPVVYMGQSVPLMDLEGFVHDLHPSMIVLVAMTDSTVAELAAWPQWLPDLALTGRPVVGYGGRAFVVEPELQRQVPGIYLGDDFRAALDLIERLI